MVSLEFEPKQSVVARLANLPLVSSTCDLLALAYCNTKDNHPYLRSICEVAETGVKTLTSVALAQASPIIDKLKPQIAAANDLACKGLDKIEQTWPILNQPPEKVVTSAMDIVMGAKEVVAITTNGAREALRVARLVSTGVDSALSTSETLVDQYLPLTDDELEKEAKTVEGFEGASKPSYYVRLGSLSTKLRKRAYRQALAKVHEAKVRSQESISQLHHTVDLIEHARRNVGDLSQWKSGGHDGDAQHMESRTLTIARSLTYQLQTTCLSLAPSLQGLPQNIQHQALSVALSASEIYSNFSGAFTFQDLSDSALASSRGQLARIKESMDGVMDYLVNNTPLNWLVPDFTFTDLAPEPEGAFQESEVSYGFSYIQGPLSRIELRRFFRYDTKRCRRARDILERFSSGIEMEQTSCRENRIHHALDRCLHGLSPAPSAVHSGNAGLSMNHWSLEELVRRDPANFHILLTQILRRAREVQDQGQYELVTPLALMFSSTLLLTPYLPPDCPLLARACEVFSGFLSWPEPYGGVCRDLLTVIHLELKAPGMSYHRLVMEEQGLSTAGQHAKTMTVLLMDPADVPPEFLSVSERMSSIHQAHQETHITLIKHAYQAALGTKYPLPTLHHALQSKSPEQLEQLSFAVTEILETCASMEVPEEARGYLLQGLEELWENIRVQASDNRNSDGVLQTLPLPIAKFHLHLWDSDNFDSLADLLERECVLATIPTLPEEEEEEEMVGYEEGGDETQERSEEIEEEAATDRWAEHRASTVSTVSSTSKDSMYSTSSAASSCSAPCWLSEASGADSDFCEDVEDSPPKRSTPYRPRLGRHLSKLFKTRSPLSRAKSLGSPETKGYAEKRNARSNSRRQKLRLVGEVVVAPPLPPALPLESLSFQKVSVLSSDGDERGCGSTLRVVVFGTNCAVGKIARACTRLCSQESALPARVQFFFIPVARGPGCAPSEGHVSPEKLPESSPRAAPRTDMTRPSLDDSTNDIAQFMGMLDPWYERNVLSFLDLPVDVLCQQTPKMETDSHNSSREHLPIFADLVLYYCRQGNRSMLVQLYQAELTLAGGERRTEVFIHSLELGHTAGTRAVRATRAASKRFGVVGDREAVPLKLEVLYNKVTVSGRSQWTQANVVCTSINLTKACKSLEELGSGTEWLQMAVTEVQKRQNSKSKMCYNQRLSTTEVKVDQVQVSSASNTTFAVCLDQDEKKVLQSVTRCEVSVYSRSDSTSEWRLHTDPADQCPGPLHAACSRFCLPLVTFSGMCP
ncbi:hypothetical protein SKAU_G00293320 [Synaphobranchus kaupii]|uniref:Phosphoinositide 3-kinase regulatory subunit 5 n=1 Tax=Synaphobranchus kaupii TaxID=118154 RepID=A0A9Q1EUB6_SYNKA|nr:hypothetical protein SKAU_G00293320 [Synaphobranchus kaupii]